MGPASAVIPRTWHPPHGGHDADAEMRLVGRLPAETADIGEESAMATKIRAKRRGPVNGPRIFVDPPPHARPQHFSLAPV
jgi:hypothetical protein